MRIKSLYIKDYNILQSFSIDFTSNLSVLIGENGSGKSSVLECVAYIFGHLHKYFILDDKTADFIDGYKIVYEINDYDIFIESKYVSSKTNTFKPTIKINEEVLSISQIKSRYGGFKTFLPEKIILSYSGITERLKELNEHFEKKLIQKIAKYDNPFSLKPLLLPKENPFIYVKKEFVSYIVLSLFVLNTEESNRVLKTLGVDINGCTTTIQIKKPSWAKSKNQNDNNNLWGVTNIAADLFRGLNDVGILTKKTEGKNGPEEFYYEFYGSNMIQDLFQGEFNLQVNQIIPFLYTLLCDDLLGSINIEWNKVYSIDKLSEGEKQLLLSVGLSLVLNKRNILFLLDEPDVSLHPKWQQEFVSRFKEGLHDESMAVITTHSPILVGDLKKTFVQIIKNGNINKSEENYSFGRDVNSILKDYFNVNKRNKHGDDFLKNFYDSMHAKDYDKAEDYLNELKTNFGPEDVSTVRAESLFDDLAE